MAHRLCLLLWLGLLITLTGCTPDRWDTLQVNWSQQLEREDARPAPAIPDEHPDIPAAADSLPDLQGDGPLALSLEQASLLALRRNRDLAVEQLNPAIAGTFEQIERGRFDPELFGSASYNEEARVETARATGTRFQSDSKSAEVGVGVRQDLPTGTSVEARLDHTRDTSNRTPEQQEARFGLTVTQSLLRGLGPAVNLARVEQARLGARASQYELRGYIEALLAQTESAYWRYVVAQEEIAIFQRSLDFARQQLEEIEQRISVGALPDADAAVARAEVARREQALIDARALVQTRHLELLRLLSPSDSGRLTRALQTTSSLALEAQPITDLDQRVLLAQRLRPDLNEARLQLEEDRLETIVTRNGLLPKLDFFVTLGRSGFGNTVNQPYRTLADDNYDVTVGLTFSQTLGNRTAQAEHLQAHTQRRQSAAAVSNLQQQIELEVRLAGNEVERARQQIDASRATHEYQAQTAEAERQRYLAGASTALQVAQAQRDLLAAEIAQAEAVVTYRLALIELHRTDGSLLDRRGVAVRQPR